MRLACTLLFALGLGVSGTSSALTIEIEGLTAPGMGVCGTTNYGATFQPCDPLPPVGDSPGIDDTGGPGNGLAFDWLILDAVPETVLVGSTFAQTGFFGVGDTGSVATNPFTYDLVLPSRLVTVRDDTSSDTWDFSQIAHLTIGMITDTLVLDPGSHTFELNSGNFVVTISGFEVSASVDPPVVLDGTITPAVPLPSTVALLGLGLGLLGWRRRLAA